MGAELAPTLDVMRKVAGGFEGKAMPSSNEKAGMFLPN